MSACRLRRISPLSTLVVVSSFALVASCGSSTGTGPVGGGSAGTLGVGASAPVIPGAAISIDGGTSGGEYVLVVADTLTSGSGAASSFQVSATGISAAGSVSLPSTSRVPSLTRGSGASLTRVDYGTLLNLAARPRLQALVATARQTHIAASRGISRSLSASVPAVGDLINYNVSQSDCDNIVIHPTRVVAVGSKAIVAVDTLNPPGGFVATDYARIAANFDTLVYPLDVTNFGAPSDIDANGHVVLLFTRAVNELTPAGSQSFIGGFFFSRDLFPQTTNTAFQGCPGSNVGEMFYLLAPDPTGAVNGHVRTKGFVDSLTNGTVAHEFQHLINSSRRLYVNNVPEAASDEDVWLNEGLSHVAEELLFYRQGNLAPRINLDAPTIRASAAAVNAFNMDQAQNAGRYSDYLKAPALNSPFREDDSLSTRGATWDFLRYAADRKVRVAGSTEVSVWQALVNSSTIGMANLRAVFGADMGAMFRDWAVSLYADDLVAADANFAQPSWNWRSVYPALGGAYPLATNSLTLSGASSSIIPGGSAFYRFAIPANGTGSLTLTSGGAASGVVLRIR